MGFQPDLTWIKQRGDNTNNVLYDSVRGPYWTIQSNTTAIQSADDGLTGWNSDGFNIGNVDTTNLNTSTYVGWNWKAGTSVSGNTTGSGTSKAYTGSVNTTSGFSIIKYSGNGTAGHTIPHHLGSVPKTIIMKRIDATGGSAGLDAWQVYHQSLGNTKRLVLNSTGGEDASTTYFNDTTPTSSVFTLGTGPAGNNTDYGYIAYCFAEKQGYSKFGSYTGNGNSDNGTFVYTGFKASYVIIKQTNASGEAWIIKDNKRGAFNQNNPTLFANVNTAESNREYTDFLSNGFKCKDNSSAFNASGASYIYMAFAEAPLVGTNNVPCTAR